jgi:hypothetical protein
MPRKPSAVLQYKLRIREALRRRIEQAAKKRGVSANYEMTSRLEQSFEQEASRSNEAIAEDMKINWTRYGEMFHELAKRGDLIRAAEALVKQIDAEDGSKAVATAAEKLRQVIKMFDQEAAIALRKMHTTGGDQ